MAMQWLATALVVLAVSLDGLAVGTAYGLRRISIPAGSMAIIGAVSTLLVAAVAAAGGWLGTVLQPWAAARLGAAILLVLGLSLTWQAWRRGHGTEPPVADPCLLVRLRFPGLLVQIWRDPGAADLDRSGRLEGWEATALGLSLALDAVAAGLGMALNGGGFLFAALVGPVQVMLVSLGSRLAVRLPRIPPRSAAYASGGILMAVALMRMM